jgi:ubiquinol-cytochrome c reductase cytochrome b subunit
MYEFGIEVSIRDIQLIYKIKKLLGVGTIYIRNKSNSNNRNSENLNVESSLLSKNVRNNVIFRIRNKSHLKNIIIPIFDKFPMFTNKQYDYIRFRSLLLSNTIYSNELLTYIRPIIVSNNLENILSTSYFPA